MERVRVKNKDNKLDFIQNKVLYIAGLRFDLSGYCCILLDQKEDEEWIVSYIDYNSFLNDFQILEE